MGEKQKMIRLIIARHGETEYNVSGLIQGQRDSKLTKNGKEQAEALSDRLKRFRIDKIYTSTLSRSIDTAKIINNHHKVKINKTKTLNERSWGELEGKQGIWVDRTYPGSLKDPFFRAKKGENLKDVYARAEKFLSRIISENNNGKTTLIVAHKVVNIALIGSLEGMILRKAYKLKQDPTCINIIEITKKKNKVNMFNNTDHLKKKGLSKVREKKGIC